MPTISDFIVLYSGEFELPGLLTSKKGSTHSRSFQDFDFQLPVGTNPTGIISFVVSTSKGEDDGIDLAYNLRGYSWVHHSQVFFGIQLPIGGLTAGHNNVRFDMTKGGTVTEPDPDENLGGKGKLRIGQVCLHYQRLQ